MKLLTRIATLAALAGTGLGLTRRRQAVAAVAPELRHPALWLPMSIRGDRLVRVLRALAANVPAATVDGVAIRADTVPASGVQPAVGVFVYEPEGRTRPSGALLWLHGGGLVLGTAEQDHELAGGLAREAGVLVVSVTYRLAPEHPFPAALDDCHHALHWLHEHAKDLGVDPTRIAVGGGSAGGGLAAALAQQARDRASVPIAFQLLEYPMLDDMSALRTDERAKSALVWTTASNRYGWSAYLGHPAGLGDVHPYAVPGRSYELAGLPPAWIGVGDIDLFHDEDVSYGHRLAAAGVAAHVHVEPRMFHGADMIRRNTPSMTAFRARMASALRSAVG
jgi:acetyl esterase/lipase